MTKKDVQNNFELKQYGKYIVIFASILLPILLYKGSASVASFILIGIIDIYACIKKRISYEINNKYLLISFAFSLLVTICNYDIINIFNGLLIFGCSFILFYVSFEYFMEVSLKKTKRDKNEIFYFSFVTIFLTYVIYLFLFVYPGTFSPDFYAHLDEIYYGTYTNKHPYVYVQFLRLFLNVFNYIFKGYDKAVILFLVFQCLIGALVFAYGITSIRNTKYFLPTYLAYVLLLYHESYATTLVKDTLFIYLLVLMIVSLYKIITNQDNLKLNYFIFSLAMFLMCLCRHNGVLLLVGLLIYLLVAYRDKYLIILVSVVTVVVLIIDYPLASYLNLEGLDKTETITFTSQQIARTVIENDAQLEDPRILDILSKNEWESYYIPDYADYLKFILRKGGYVRDNFSEYLDIWFKNGLRHPWTYTKAFIDTSKYYYYAGYKAQPTLQVNTKFYTVMNYDRPGTDGSGFKYSYLGELFPSFMSARLPNNVLIKAYLKLDVLHAVGLHVWMMWFCLLKGIIQKRKETILIIPLLVLSISLIFAPCPEFRYIYALFASLPILVPIFVQEKQ